jgi:hypothetical protein
MHDRNLYGIVAPSIDLGVSDPTATSFDVLGSSTCLPYDPALAARTHDME